MVERLERIYIVNTRDSKVNQHNNIINSQEPDLDGIPIYLINLVCEKTAQCSHKYTIKVFKPELFQTS